MKKETKKDQINKEKREKLLSLGVQDLLNKNKNVKIKKKHFRVVKRTTHGFEKDTVYYQLQSRYGLFNHLWIDHGYDVMGGWVIDNKYRYKDVHEALFNRDILNGDIKEVEEIIIPDKR